MVCPNCPTSPTSTKKNIRSVPSSAQTENRPTDLLPEPAATAACSRSVFRDSFPPGLPCRNCSKPSLQSHWQALEFADRVPAIEDKPQLVGTDSLARQPATRWEKALIYLSWPHSE